MANELDTIQFSASSKFHQHIPSIDSHIQNKVYQYPSNFDYHQINKEIQFIADYAQRLIKTTEQSSDKYKYIIRIAEISMKAKEVDNNKKLLDDIVDELSIILSHCQKSKTVQLLLTKLISLYRKKQTNFNNRDSNIKKFGLIFNKNINNRNNVLSNFIESTRMNTQTQKSFSPSSQYQNSMFLQKRDKQIQNQVHKGDNLQNYKDEHLQALFNRPMSFQRQKNYYLSKY
ncbi:unnamed protein product (macronuclear) [Paramecium tetraurelia]|uniref:ENTH domain-containing protein n=1 Tax=Paramecium tetraurelia TaxID=5888 RepID=A0C332_PARTE|nr:uncharacterized protein GSPATT00034677001 [Paramecium tetraurelia]CAK65199.1 unnamed protein product [Paramecium tetraurelia]|eukprot:XP_001432596.1 hypothetical protein (macronuclear) [Paramecium tetraurelia strain d4-2]